MELESFVCSGSTKKILIETLEFVMKVNKINIKGFFIDKSGYLVFCRYDIKNDNYIKYPFEQTSISLTEHIYSYINSLSQEKLEEMNCILNGYEEEYELGWELFIPDFNEGYRVSNYDWYNTTLAVKPKIIEYGK